MVVARQSVRRPEQLQKHILRDLFGCPVLARNPQGEREHHPLMPLYFYVSKHLVKPRVTGWYSNVMNVTYSKDLGLRRAIH